MTTLERLQLPVKHGEHVFIAPGAQVMGSVELGDEVSVWFNAVLRGDTEQLSIGARTNIQDLAIIHADPGDPAIIGNDCTIGHGAIVHGARIAHHVLVGMHATVLNNAEVGEYSVIGANALVPSGMKIPPYSLVLGVPAKVVRTLGPEQESAIANSVSEYVEKAAAFMHFYHQGSSSNRAAE
ncbi:MAG: gamma carbonic anhydrase family protein [Bacteroidetes bacterium]|nr:gamma carbonic anhydrase family protein [Bacteroidota bacterium]